MQVSGRLYEAGVAALQRRPRCALFHTALVVDTTDGRYVVEVAPIPDLAGESRGVVATGAVGSRRLGRLRVFRYEVRVWRDGVIPDLVESVATERFDLGADRTAALLALVGQVPTPVWGRDELRAGEMWNSNSVTSWLLARSGVDMTTVGPPRGGRAPGWDAGIEVAARAPRPATG